MKTLQRFCIGDVTCENAIFILLLSKLTLAKTFYTSLPGNIMSPFQAKVTVTLILLKSNFDSPPYLFVNST